MTVDLDKQDVITLIKGSFVPWELMDHPLISKLGVYVGGFQDKWYWNSNNVINQYAEEDLLQVYYLLKSKRNSNASN